MIPSSKHFLMKLSITVNSGSNNNGCSDSKRLHYTLIVTPFWMKKQTVIYAILYFTFVFYLQEFMACMVTSSADIKKST